MSRFLLFDHSAPALVFIVLKSILKDHSIQWFKTADFSEFSSIGMDLDIVSR